MPHSHRNPATPTQKRSLQERLRSRKRGANTIGQKQIVETTGELFSDGFGVELVRDAETGRLDFVVFDGKKLTVAPRFEHAGRIYVPPVLDPATLGAVRFPEKCKDYGSTTKLFGAIHDQLRDRGISEQIALRASYFALSSWFSDCLPIVPCLLITGPTSEANLLLELLECLVRHPLALVEMNASGLCSLPRCLRPTLLVYQENLSPSAFRVLLASNKPNGQVLRNGRSEAVCFAKALYRGLAFDDELHPYASLKVNVVPSRESLLILDCNAQDEIAREFQPMLLNYRFHNFGKVRNSQFELPEFSSEIRVLSRALGACIVDAPELQSGLRPVLQELENEFRVGRWSDLRCVTVEALLFHCHIGGGEDLVHIGKIASAATTIFKARGEAIAPEPKAVGAIIRSLGFSLKRDNRGYALRLTDANRRRIHGLARDLDVAAVQEGGAQCAHCAVSIAACDHQAPTRTDSQKTRVAQRKGRA